MSEQARTAPLAPPRPRDEVVVASYNVHRCVGIDGRHELDRVAAVIAELDADVIGLQEIDSGAGIEHGRDQLDALARGTGYAHVAGPTLRRRDGHVGNGLLTRLPVTSVRPLDLSVPRREPRGALDVEMELATPGGPARLRVVATHFGLAAAERRAQCERLLGLLAPRGEDYAVLLGDFNEWFAPARLLRRIHSTFGPARGVRSWPSPLPLLALDRIWVHPDRSIRSFAAHRSPLARCASDHLPVRAVIAVAGSRARPSRTTGHRKDPR